VRSGLVQVSTQYEPVRSDLLPISCADAGSMVILLPVQLCLEYDCGELGVAQTAPDD
jgi:hypothetical protein